MLKKTTSSRVTDPLAAKAEAEAWMLEAGCTLLPTRLALSALAYGCALWHMLSEEQRAAARVPFETGTGSSSIFQQRAAAAANAVPGWLTAAERFVEEHITAAALALAGEYMDAPLNKMLAERGPRQQQQQQQPAPCGLRTP